MPSYANLEMYDAALIVSVFEFGKDRKVLRRSKLEFHKELFFFGLRTINNAIYYEHEEREADNATMMVLKYLRSLSK